MTTYFGTTAFFPGSVFAVAALLALGSGRVVDCRRGKRLILARRESPIYYWFVMLLLVGIAIAMIAMPAPLDW